jgi:DNA replication protein DnaC
MEDIEKNKDKYTKFFAAKYYKKKEEHLTQSERYRCSSLGEIWAYYHSVIPEGHTKYTIFDFDGRISNSVDKSSKSVLTDSIIISAKNKICNYCWGMSWEEVKEQNLKNNNVKMFLRKNSVMMDRMKYGNNIIIFGASSSPLGRTMLASIVMKEAIKLRITHSDKGQNYDWIDFNQLFQSLRTNSDDLVDYKSCDWLVVDNISRKMRTEKQTTLLVDVVDSFFIERFKNKLPTILVFKSDIRDKSFSMEQDFGVGLYRILTSGRTVTIPLTEKDD